MPASTSQRRTKPKVRRNSDVIGRNGIYQRWKNYIDYDRRGNTELRKLVEQQGEAYVETHFRYTLLEHYDSTVPKNVVLARETYWKQALDTRKHGYNDN